jgi:hypothetical protein
MSEQKPASAESGRPIPRIGHCPVCDEPNGCRLETGEAYKGPCWCEWPVLTTATLQRLLEDLAEPRCLCRRCLEFLAAHPEATWEDLVPDRTPPYSPIPKDGESYLEDGCTVFTAKYHLRRGSCCHSGCRHCPFLPPPSDAASGPR